MRDSRSVDWTACGPRECGNTRVVRSCENDKYENISDVPAGVPSRKRLTLPLDANTKARARGGNTREEDEEEEGNALSYYMFRNVHFLSVSALSPLACVRLPL